MEKDDMSDTLKNTGCLLGEMKKFLKLIMRIAAQAYEYTKNCWIAHFKNGWMVRYVYKAVTKKVYFKT